MAKYRIVRKEMVGINKRKYDLETYLTENAKWYVLISLTCHNDEDAKRILKNYLEIRDLENNKVVDTFEM